MNIRRRTQSRAVLLWGMVVPALALGMWARSLGKVGLGQAALSPTSSGPIALTHDNRFVWVANPENNSVSLLEVGGDVNRKLKEIKVGQEPQGVAITPDDKKVYVTNMVSGTVSVIDAVQRQVVRVILVGTEPFGCAVTPDGKKLYVANFSSDDVSVIDTSTDKVIKTIADAGPKPRAIAINTDGKVYVTQFLAVRRIGETRPPTQSEGRDDGREGHVTVINSATDTILGTAVLNPLANVGNAFKSNGSTLDRIPLRSDANGNPIFDTITGAFPNLLGAIVIQGNRAYVPNTGESPNGPFRFNVNVQSFLSVLDTQADQDSGQTINMNDGVNFEPANVKLFNTNPIAVAFKHSGNEGFVAVGATDRLLRITLDGAGKPSINAPAAAGGADNIVRVVVGKNPRGIVINSTDTRAYVMNYISRDVSAVDLTKNPPVEIARIASASLPTPGTLAERVHRGEELFVTAIGPAGTVGASVPPAGRMSDTGWGACYSCHPEGLTDSATWMFPDGPRQSVSMENTAEHPQAALLNVNVNANGAPLLPAFHQRLLNWSAVRDEIQDFELNIRAVSGGQGLIDDGQGVFNLTPTSTTGRSADMDTIAAYICFGVRAPISPLRPKNVGGLPADPDLAAGRALFASANCQSCHGGPNWTRSLVTFTPPPNDPTQPDQQIVVGQLTFLLRDVGTFDSNLFFDGVSNEIRPNLTANTIANGGPVNGKQVGFNIPSLRSVFAGAPYLHSGAAQTLDEVLDNVTHRSAGTAGVDTLSSAADRAKVVKFLKSIDAKTPLFP